MKQAKVASYFNSRPSARGDFPDGWGVPDHKISIHAPPRGATALAKANYSYAFKFQFTPLREGRQKALEDIKTALKISIHAPPRGATHQQRSLAAPFDFNSRPSARGDKCFLVINYDKDISIHAPPRGATYTNNVRLPRLLISIHAPPRGATAAQCRDVSRKFYFNSRPSARGDIQSAHGLKTCRYFNSRPSARGDGKQFVSFGIETISIHAPPRGATQTCQEHQWQCGNFNSRPSARGDDVVGH